MFFFLQPKLPACARSLQIGQAVKEKEEDCKGGSRALIQFSLVSPHGTRARYLPKDSEKNDFQKLAKICKCLLITATAY